MFSILQTLHLSPLPSGIEPPSHPALIILFNFGLAYVVTSSRYLKNKYRFDNNIMPRSDTATRGPARVKAGKMTQKQLDRILRLEGAHANGVEHFPFLFGSVLFMVLGGVPASTLNRIGAVYSIARVAYVLAYYYIDTLRMSGLRSVLWWVGNICCITAVVKSANRLP